MVPAGGPGRSSSSTGWPSRPGRRPGAGRGCGPARSVSGHGRGRPGLGPVGLEQGLLQPFELTRDDGAGHRIEGHGPEPGAGEAGDQVDVSSGPPGLGLLVGALGIGQLLPVGHGLAELVEAQMTGLADEQGLVPGQGLSGLGGAEGGHDLDVGTGDVTVDPGPLYLGQGGEGPAPAHLAAGLGLRDPAPDRQPGRGGAGPVGAQFPDRSKAAVARVVSASRRASWRWRETTDSGSANTAGSTRPSRSSSSVRPSRETASREGDEEVVRGKRHRG